MEGRRGLIGSVDDSIEVMGSTSWWQRKWRDLQDDGNEGDGMIALLKIRKDEIRKNERRWWAIYRTKEHGERSNAFVQKRGQPAYATCPSI